jgi:putative ABC transport system permease protein
VIAAGLGLVAGLGLTLALKALLAGFGMTLPSITIVSGSLVTAFVAGVVITVVAALLPAIRASRVAPIEALRDNDAEPASPSTVRAAIGALATIAGAVVVATATSSSDGAVGRAALGALVVLVGVVMVGPAIARPVASTIGAPIAWARRQPGRLARRNAMRNPRRTASSALALVIGTAIVALFATFGASIQQSIDDTVSRSFGGDLVLTQDNFSGAGLAPQVGNEIAKLPEVEHSAPLSNATIQVEGKDQYPTVVDPGRLAGVIDLDVEEGDLAAVKPGELAVSHKWADDHDVEVGSTLPVRYVDGKADRLTVSTIYGVSDLMGEILMTPQDWTPHAQRADDVAVLIELRDGVDLAEGKAAVQKVADRYGAPDVQDRDEFIEAQAGQIDQLLTLVYGMLALAVVIAVMGLANTLSLSIHERTRELGLLRALGLTRAQTRSTVRWESVITSVLGTAVGLGLGTFLGWGLVRAFAAQEGFVSFRAPTTTLLVVTLLAAGAGIVAAVRPAHRAARLDVLGAIAGD